MSTLTREQVLKITDKILKEGYPWKHELNFLCDHDQAQRDTIAALEMRVQELEVSLERTEGAYQAKATLWIEQTRVVDELQQQLAALRGQVNTYEKILQLVHFILEHQDGDYDRPDIIQAEAEQYGIEKLFAIKQQLAAREAELHEVKVQCGKNAASEYQRVLEDWKRIEAELALRLQAELARLKGA